jgi:hypothetical protein
MQHASSILAILLIQVADDLAVDLILHLDRFDHVVVLMIYNASSVLAMVLVQVADDLAGIGQAQWKCYEECNQCYNCVAMGRYRGKCDKLNVLHGRWVHIFNRA